MENMKFLRLKSCVIFFVMTIVTVSGIVTDTQELLTKLFTTNSYNKKIRPIQDHTKVMNISMNFAISAITRFDEQEGSLTTAGYLSIFWKDEMLSWAAGDHSGIERVIIPQDDVWKPDISLRNSFNSFGGLGASHFNVWMNSDGTIIWEPFQVLKSTCPVDITHFPYDTQTCIMKFVTWSYSDAEIAFLEDSVIDKKEYLESSTWHLVSSSAKVENKQTPTIVYILKLRRKPIFYVLNMVIPVILLSVLNIFTFALPAKSGERVSYSVTLFLSISVFLTIIASEFPKNSDTPSYLALYLIHMISFSTVFVLISILQIRLVHRGEENKNICRFYTTLHHVVQVLRCKKNKECSQKVSVAEGNTSIGNEDSAEPEDFKQEVTWSSVVDAIDFLCLWLGSLVIFIVTLAMMILLMNN